MDGKKLDDLLRFFYFASIFLVFYASVGVTLGIHKFIGTRRRALAEAWTAPWQVTGPLLNAAVWTFAWPIGLLLETLF